MMENAKGISAVIATILMLMITIALAGVAYMYISGMFTQQTGIVLEFDETATSCSGTTISVYLKNMGTQPVKADQITISGTNSEGTSIASTACGTSSTILNATAGSALCANTLTGTEGVNTVIASGPTNTVKGTIYCSG